MSNNTLSIDFELLRCECATISEFLKMGIDTIRNIGFPNEGKLLNSMFSLSQGYERFLKVVYAIMFKSTNNRFPTNDEFKKLGHNISNLFDEVIKQANSLNLKNTYLTKIENKEEPYHSIINILNDFASMLRYHNFTMLSSSNPSISPTHRWHLEVEENVIQNKNIYISNIVLSMANELDLQEISISYFIDYEGNRIASNKDQYLICQRQKVIDKYTKMYLCHIVQALSELLYNLPNGSFLNEFFWGFNCDDSYLRKTKKIR